MNPQFPFISDDCVDNFFLINVKINETSRQALCLSVYQCSASLEAELTGSVNVQTFRLWETESLPCNNSCLCCVGQWLQDVIALQCSIMRHLSIKQRASSTAASTQWDFEHKASVKSSGTSEDVKTRATLERTSSPDPCSKPCSIPKDSQGTSLSRDSPSEPGVCKCNTTPCQNCRKSNGPLELAQPPRANGPVDCNSTSDPCRQAELQNRLKPGITPSDSASASGLVNHLGTEMVKKEPESTVNACAQKNRPAAPTIWTHGGPQNHRSQTQLQEEGVSSEEKPSLSITSSSLSEAPSKGSQEHDSVKLGSSSPAPGMWPSD